MKGLERLTISFLDYAEDMAYEHKVMTMKDWIEVTDDLLKFRNFGKKSLTELEALLENNNLEFGMDVAKYKLDKE